MLPTGQSLPGVVDVTALVSSRSPGSGLRTTTEYAMVALSPTARSPVQVRLGAVKLTVPMVAVAPPGNVASSSTPARESVNVAR